MDEKASGPQEAQNALWITTEHRTHLWTVNRHEYAGGVGPGAARIASRATPAIRAQPGVSARVVSVQAQRG
ncbi:Uncharacterised protein [Mycobacteroides abscessus subsp. abscessus]|nr:Uncharacterised protein [Mycobacteroides abscessus subsp. abscessus]